MNTRQRVRRLDRRRYHARRPRRYLVHRDEVELIMYYKMIELRELGRKTIESWQRGKS